MDIWRVGCQERSRDALGIKGEAVGPGRAEWDRSTGGVRREHGAIDAAVRVDDDKRD